MTVQITTPERAPSAWVRDAADQATRADGVAPLGEQPLRALDRPAGAELVHVVAVSAGHEVGYAQVAGPAGGEVAAELFVRPGARGRGAGRALVDEVLRRSPEAGLWAHGDLPAATALAAQTGLRRDRELLVMSRPLADLPEPRPVPGGIEIGTLAEAEPAAGAGRWPGLDARAELLRVNNAAFDWHPEQGGWTAGQLADRLGVDWVDPAGIVLAVDVTGRRPRLVGFHWTKVHPAGPTGPGAGEVYVVGVDPADRGRHLGAVLTEVGLQVLRDAGCREVELYVEGDNAPALRTYERLGFEVVLRDVAYRRG